MKKLHYFACLVLSAAFALPAFGNHRTGTLALPELLVAGDLNELVNAEIMPREGDRLVRHGVINRPVGFCGPHRPRANDQR